MTPEPVALVTGAARGIGAATVRKLCSEGYRVLAVDACDKEPPPGVTYRLPSQEELEQLSREFPNRVVTLVADVRNLDAMRLAAATALETFGRLNVAVANAAVMIGGSPLWQTDYDHVRSLIDVNSLGAWNTAVATVPHFLKDQRPDSCRFIALASSAGQRGLFQLAGYTVSKHAVVGLVRGLAADLVGTGIVSIAVSPGGTDTHMLEATAHHYGLSSAASLAEASLLRRLITPDEIAQTISFCCSPAGAILNGSVVEATGGSAG